jgi:nucleotide-binding universal stress UspA family protein
MSGEAWVLHVAEAEPDLVGFDVGPEVVRDQVAREFREEHKAVQQHTNTLREAGIEANALFIRGPIVETILQQAERIEADLLIVGSHGFGALYDLLVGSSSRGVLKHSGIPVLVVPIKDE